MICNYLVIYPKVFLIIKHAYPITFQEDNILYLVSTPLSSQTT